MWPINTRFALVLLACGCASTQAPSANSPTAANTSLQGVSKRFALVGSDGVVVEVVDLQDGNALVRVSGVDGPLQNKVVSHRRAQEGKDLRYTTQWAGREWLTLLRSGTSSWMRTYWQLTVPGSEAISVSYDEGRSEKVEIDSLFAAHEKQRSAGELDRLQQFNQASERGREDEVVTTSAGVASRECGSPLTASIDWSTVVDQALREHSVSDYCVSALRAVQSACFSSPELKAFVQQQVKEVSCRFDGSGEMSLSAGRLIWSMNLELSELDTLAGKAFTRISLPEESGPTASNSSPSGSR